MSFKPTEHRAIFINNQSQCDQLIEDILNGLRIPAEFKYLKDLKGVLFSKGALDDFIEEEEIHDQKWLTSNTEQSLKSMSSGERKKALLAYLLQSDPDYLILLNPFDNLDSESQIGLKERLIKLSTKKQILLFLSRKADLLPFISNFYFLKDKQLIPLHLAPEIENPSLYEFTKPIPKPLERIPYEHAQIVQLKNVCVSYGSSQILDKVNWVIRPGEFWKLSGPNGSGKSTLLSMINGDNPKAYGQDINIFGYQKGKGESVWDLKKSMGYFTPAMIDRFKGYHSLENMIISGLFDSIGLYVKPGNVHQRLAKEWLELIGMDHKKDKYFHTLSLGEKHLIMCIRAMIKHPPLLILDEPTAGLDDKSAALVVALANKMAQESETAIIFVSHREEPLLKTQYEFQLSPAESGSLGVSLPHGTL